MSLSGLINIGLSGLSASNQALLATSNNISNVNTPGYTVEEPILTTIKNPSFSLVGQVGNGVEVSTIQRMFNSFVNQQLNTENSNLSYWNNYQSGMSNVENVLNTASTTSISTAMTSFYNDWQAVSQNPSDSAQRTVLISDANNLSSQLSGSYTLLDNERSQLFSNSQSLANTVNTDTAEIASLNASIAGNPGALDLQDQRDYLIQQLNSLVKVTTFHDNSGMTSVLIGGTPLVEGSKSFNMSVNTDAANNMHFYVAIDPAAAPGSTDNPDITSSVSGGQLGANLALRDTTIPSYIKQLNAFAVDLSNTTNYYQNQGYGLDGKPGSNFFSSLSSLAKYTSVDSVNGVFTLPSDTFSTNGGTLSIKLGANDASPATVNIAANSTLQDVVSDINQAAGSKVAASVVNAGPATQFTVNAANDTFNTNLPGGPFTVPAGTYTGSSLASAITALGAGINVEYNSGSGNFTITPTTAGGASSVDLTGANSIGSLIGFSGNQTIGTGITGTVPDDYRISIRSNSVGNLGQVNIGVTTNDGAGSGLNLLATSAAITSTNVTDTTSLDPNAQYKIDYNYTGGSGYQEESTTGIYWRVQKSDDGGGTWKTINPNTSYNSSDSSTINQNEVNLTADSAGLNRSLEFEGIKVQIDGNGLNSTTNPNGETFDVQLDRNAAKDITTVITDPNEVAASSDTWNVNSSNNSVVFNVNGGPNITATIPQGTYTNDPGQSDDISAALTSAIQTAYQTATGNALPDTLSAAFNTNTKQFNITMSGGSDSINLLWSNSASTANQIFGFSNNASLNSFPINASNNTIVFNDGSGSGVQTVNILPLGSYTGANLAAAINSAMADVNLSVAYNAATNNFTITNSGGTAATINWAIPQQLGFAPGTTDISAGGSVSSAAVGNSAASDNHASVYSNANKGVPGDNRNATAIANLASGNSFAGTTPVDFYNSLVSNVGVEAAAANNNQTFESNLVRQLTQQQQQVSGVSLDEEASNLITYQQSYQAAAKVITVAQELVTVLLGIIGGSSG